MEITKAFKDYAMMRLMEKAKVEYPLCKTAIHWDNKVSFEVTAFLNGKLCYGQAFNQQNAVDMCLAQASLYEGERGENVMLL